MSRLGGTAPTRVTVVLLTALALLLGAGPAPASAHGDDAPAGADYLSRVVGTDPAVPGLTVRVVEAGARLELANHTGRTVRVLGYQGEPYLEIRPDGVYENVRSPATYLNRTLDGDTPLPPTVNLGLLPQWRRTGNEPVARWHDRRIRWTDERPPEAVRADPDRRHRVRDWTVPLRHGDAAVHIRGTLDWLPPPHPVRWWLAALVGALAVAVLGLVAPTGPRGRAAGAALAGLCAAAGAAALAHAGARAVADGGGTVTGVLSGLLGTHLWTTVSGLAALAAGAYALTRRPATDFALALAGAAVAVFAGVVDAAVFSRAVPAVPWPGDLARVLVAGVTAIGAGVSLAAALRLRATGRAGRDRTPPGTGPDVPRQHRQRRPDGTPQPT